MFANDHKNHYNNIKA